MPGCLFVWVLQLASWLHLQFVTQAVQLIERSTGIQQAQALAKHHCQLAAQMVSGKTIVNAHLLGKASMYAGMLGVILLML